LSDKPTYKIKRIEGCPQKRTQDAAGMKVKTAARWWLRWQSAAQDAGDVKKRDNSTNIYVGPDPAPNPIPIPQGQRICATFYGEQKAGPPRDFHFSFMSYYGQLLWHHRRGAWRGVGQGQGQGQPTSDPGQTKSSQVSEKWKLPGRVFVFVFVCAGLWLPSVSLFIFLFWRSNFKWPAVYLLSDCNSRRSTQQLLP